ncbi:hypothetical protein BH11ACT5_BH11ACT5_09380 [soil metagenome]
MRAATIAVCVLLGLSLSGCVQPSIITADTVTGNWIAPDGGTIHIDPDGTFEASDLLVSATTGNPSSDFEGRGIWSITEADAAEGKLSIQWVETNSLSDDAGMHDTFRFFGSGDDMRLALLNLFTDQDVDLRRAGS